MAITSSTVTVVEDSIAGAGAGISWDMEGAVMSRRVVVAGLRRNANVTPQTAMWDAVKYLNVYPGKFHDTDRAWAVLNISASPIGNDKAEILVRYRRIDLWTIRLDGNVVSEATVVDNAGQLLNIGYTDKTGKAWPKCVAKVPFLRAGAILEFEGFDVTDKSGLKPRVVNYGTINSDTWQGCEPYTWMYVSNRSSITTLWGGNPEFPDVYPAKYQFQYMARRGSSGAIMSDWRQVITYTNWQLRQEPAELDTSGLLTGAESGNGWKRGTLQPVGAFSSFNLPSLSTW